MSRQLCNKSIKLIPKISVSLLQKLSINYTIKNYAGHSKWQNIRHIKDEQKSLQFIKLTRQIRLAAQSGGSSNPALNSRLRATIDDALKHNMSQSTIKNVVKKCSINTKHQLTKQIIELRIGIHCKIFAIIILYSDNSAGARMQLIPIFKKHAAIIVTDCRHLFYEKCFINCYGTEDMLNDTEKIEEIATEHAIESNAEEVEIIDGKTKKLIFICNPIDINKCKQKLSSIGYRIECFEHRFIPNNLIVLANDELQKYQLLKEKLMKFDEIEEIYDNLENS